MKKTIAAIALVASCQVSALEVAAEKAYVTGGLQLTSYDVSGFDSAVGFNVGAGVPVNGLQLPEKVSIDAEAGFANFGESDNNGLTISGYSIYGAAKANYQVQDKFSVFARAGLNYATIEAEANTFFGKVTAEDSEIKLLYGFGAEYQLNDKFAVTAGYTAFASDVSALSAGVNISF